MRWSAAILGIGFLVWYAFAQRASKSQSSPQPLGDLLRALPPADLVQPSISEPGTSRFTATLYPYSVIPGGVESVAELRSALARDPAVAAHYIGFDLTRAQVVRLDKPRAAYVSYRLGERIYWTSHKLTLRKGETVITDGAHTARTRCGNLVAELPIGPRSPREPTPQIFEKPLPLDMPMGPGFDFEAPFTPEWIPEPPTIGAAPPDLDGEAYIFPTLFPIGGGGGVPLPVTPTVPTPEPSTFVLISAGLAILLVLRGGYKEHAAHPPAGADAHLK